jgi:hypothetical protein
MQVLTKQTLEELYNIDSDLWLEKTVNILKNKRFDDLDIENLIEELEALGKRDLNKVRSLLRQIIIHLLLLEYWQLEYNRNYRHWQGEVKTFRFDLNNNLITNLTNKLHLELENIYQSAVEFVEIKTGLINFPNNCPYSLTQLLDKDWFPPH